MHINRNSHQTQMVNCHSLNHRFLYNITVQNSFIQSISLLKYARYSSTASIKWGGSITSAPAAWNVRGNELFLAKCRGCVEKTFTQMFNSNQTAWLSEINDVLYNFRCFIHHLSMSFCYQVHEYFKSISVFIFVFIWFMLSINLLNVCAH